MNENFCEVHSLIKSSEKIETQSLREEKARTEDEMKRGIQSKWWKMQEVKRWSVCVCLGGGGIERRANKDIRE